MRSLGTPTVPTAPNFHSILCLSGFSLAQRLVCHLCHKHCRQQQISVVHMCWLATPARSEISLVIECSASYLNNRKLHASAFALPISLRIRVKRPITHVCMTKILRLCMKFCTQTPDFPELLLVVPLPFACPPPACPWLHCDAALNYMVTWKASHKSRVSPSVPKMAGAYSMWTLNIFFFFLTFTVISHNTLLSLLQKHNQFTYGSLHSSAHESSLTKHTFFIAS